VNKLGHRSVI